VAQEVVSSYLGNPRHFQLSWVGCDAEPEKGRFQPRIFVSFSIFQRAIAIGFVAIRHE
jgi:hypothetical protein